MLLIVLNRKAFDCIRSDASGFGKICSRLFVHKRAAAGLPLRE
jgi:hypothetical protein